MNQVALIFGGPSGEHDVSLSSAKNIFEAVSESQIKPILLGVTKNKEWKLIKPEDLVTTSFETPLDLENVGITIELDKTDEGIFVQAKNSDSDKIGPIGAAFPIIHGPYGEDGQLQSELNEIGLTFVGSDFLSCENCMDKVKTKEIISQTNVPQSDYLVFEETNPNFSQIEKTLGLPCFVKPARMGSSVGISKVTNENELLKAIAEARIYDNKILIEKNIRGRELECALLETDDGIQVTCLSEIITTHDFYSYEAKYLDKDGAKTVYPANVTPEITEKIQALAKECFKALDCRDYARADFFLADSGEIYFNEINTHPGFTNISQFPQLWVHEGISYKDLVLGLFKQALNRNN